MRCLIVDDDPVSRALLEHFVEQHGELILVGSMESSIEAAKELRTDSIDVVFLDIEMPEMSGMELIRSVDNPPQFVLVTAREKYATEAFDLEATDYLVKPVSYARFLKAIQRVEKRGLRSTPAENEKYVFVKSEGRLVKIALDEVLYCEAQRDYIKIQTAKGGHVVHSTMKRMEESLGSRHFARVHRSYIVRIDRIVDIEDKTLVIEREVIPIGASYREDLLKRLNML